jgi:hypothetical protein
MKLQIPAVVAFALATANLASAWDDPPKPKLPIGTDTTVVAGPLDKDGYIDYEAALNERLGKGITPEKNACAALWAAIGPKPDGGTRGMPPEYFKTLGIAEPPVDGNYFLDQFKFARRLELNEEERTTLFEQFVRAAEVPWVVKDFPHVAAWLKANEMPLAVVREAVKRPDYFHPHRSHRDKDSSSHMIGYSIQPASKCREFTQALITRAMLNMGEGRFDDAWQDLLACHRIARHLSRGATMVEALVGIAVDIITCRATVVWLDRADPSAERARNCATEWGKLALPKPLADTLDFGERFTILDTLQMIRRGKGVFTYGGADPPGPKDLERLDAIDWAPALREVNAWFDSLVIATREPNRVKRELFFDRLDEKQKKIHGDKSAEQQLSDLIGEGLQKRLDTAKKLPTDQAGKAIATIVLDLIGSSVRKVQGAADRADQTRHNLDLAFALHAYKKDTGKYPAKLADLTPKYLPVVPDDLFSGKPLIYKPTDSGYLLYSVGANGKDDGGRTYGEYLPDDLSTGDDIVVRMPVPAVKDK